MYGIQYLPPSVVLPVFNPTDFPVATSTADSGALTIILQQTASNQTIVSKATTLINLLGTVTNYAIAPITTGVFGSNKTLGTYLVSPLVAKLILVNLNLAVVGSSKGISSFTLFLNGNIVTTSYTASWQNNGQYTVSANSQVSISVQCPVYIPITDTNTSFIAKINVAGAVSSGTDYTVNSNITYFPTINTADIQVIYL